MRQVTHHPFHEAWGIGIYPDAVVEVAYDRDYYFPEGAIRSEADAEFIAHAREDIPALVAEVERLRKT